MTIDTRRAPARAASLFPLWCKGGKRSHGVPRDQAKVAISVQQDQDHGMQDGGHRGAQDGITTRALCRRRLLLLGWLVLAVPLQISPPLLAPFPLDIWEEDQGLYK